MIEKLKAPGRAAGLFGDWPEGILWACLQGTMGAVYAAGDPPVSAAAVLGDFAFFAGAPDAALLDLVSAPLLIPQNGAWEAAIAARWGRGVQAITRYATRKDTAFERARLEKAVRALPEGFRLADINEALYERCREEPWSRDLVSQYPDAAAYRRQGLGIAVLRGGVLAAGASSYASFKGGIEIEIDTRPEERRKGLARACGAALILACLRRGLYPSWDAHTPISLALAKELGYVPDRPYRAFVRCSPKGHPAI